MGPLILKMVELVAIDFDWAYLGCLLLHQGQVVRTIFANVACALAAKLHRGSICMQHTVCPSMIVLSK